MKPKLIELIGDEPVTLAECKAHLRVDVTADDLVIAAMAKAAREHCEEFTGLSLTERTLEIALDEFPDAAIDLPAGPVREIVSVTSGVTVLDDAGYVLDDYGTVARAVPVSTWPSTTAATNAVKVRYSAGYGAVDDETLPLPWGIRAALLLVLGTLYEHREDSAERALQALPLGVEALLRPHRVKLGMA